MTWISRDEIQGFPFNASVSLRTCVITELGRFLRYITQQKVEVMVSVNITVPASSCLLSPVRLRRSNNSGKLPTDPFCRGLVDCATHPKTVTHNMRLGAHTEIAACVSIFFHTTPFYLACTLPIKFFLSH